MTTIAREVTRIGLILAVAAFGAVVVRNTTEALQLAVWQSPGSVTVQHPTR